MKKLLFYITTLGGGGAERVLLNLLKEIDYSRFDVTVVTLTNSGVYANKLPEQVTYRSIIQSKNANVEFLETYLYYKILPAKLFHRLFLKGDYDYEIAYLMGFPSKVIQASSNKRSRKVCFVHTNVGNGEVFKSVYGSVNRARIEYEKADTICFVSEANKQAFIQLCGEYNDIRVIHNVIDVDNILCQAALKIDAGYKDDHINIVSVGRLSQPKGYLRLIKIVDELNDKYHNYTLTILGEGEEEPIIRNYIVEHGIKNVRLIPFQANPFPYVKQADLFVCSSYTEGYSTAVSEAALLGVPVITTRCDGMDEIFVEGIGVRIIENDDKSLYKAIDEYLSSKEFREILETEAKRYCTIYRERVRANIQEYNTLFQ